MILRSLVLALAIEVHGEQQWVQDGGFHNPVTGEHCCGKDDCLRFPAEQAFAIRDGWFLASTGEVIPYSQVLNSPDGHFYRCHTPLKKTRCLFVPFQGS